MISTTIRYHCDYCDREIVFVGQNSGKAIPDFPDFVQVGEKIACKKHEILVDGVRV